MRPDRIMSFAREPDDPAWPGREGSLQDRLRASNWSKDGPRMAVTSAPSGEVPAAACDNDHSVHNAAVQRGRHGVEKILHRLVERIDERALDALDHEALIRRCGPCDDRAVLPKT
jgi:hypothetical protein